MMLPDELQLFGSGMALMESYPDDIRHPIVKEEKEKIASLGCVFSLAANSGVPDQRGLINLLNVILETCYCLGYQAGKEDDVEVDEIWWGDQ
jgi:hypothetical protein